MRGLLTPLGEWLGYHIPQSIQYAALCALNDHVSNAYGGWRALIRQGIEQGLNVALTTLQALRNGIVRACRENRPLIRYMGQVATKYVARELIPSTAKVVVKKITSEAVEHAAKKGAKRVVSQGAKKAAAQSAKFLSKANPIGLAADVAQAGLEIAGYKREGKAVGATGNIVGGAMLGSVAGPPGAVVGAAVGAAVWVLGEGIGYAIDELLG